jgi:hypothetical protein
MVNLVCKDQMVTDVSFVENARCIVSSEHPNKDIEQSHILNMM